MSTVRPACPADARAIVSIRLVTWRAAYGQYLPPHVWDEIDLDAETLRLSDRLSTGAVHSLVVEADGAVRGYSVFGPPHDADTVGATEIYAMYVLPEYWSKGLGRALMAATLEELGPGTVVLWVLEDNQRARRFYEIAGFATDGARKPADLLGGVQLPEVRYRISRAG